MADKGGRAIFDRLASAIAARRCALFAGAGLTAASGGASWSELVQYLKERFRYSSPLQDGFQILGDLIGKHGRDGVYAAVQDRLRPASIEGPLLELVRMPWFTVFTPNYDSALEEALASTQSFRIKTVVTGQEFALTSLPTEMLCVKLMGSVDIAPGQPGSMVLDSGDLALAREQRSRIFDTLASHAANLSFLFVGHSFDDGVFLDILDRIVKTIGKPVNTYYAVFRTPPDEEKAYLLKQHGVEVIVADLPRFAEDLAARVALLNPEDYSRKRVPIGSDVVPIRTASAGNFMAFCDPILLEDLVESISPNAFFKGDVRSFRPFELRWPFPRKEIAELCEAANPAGGAAPAKSRIVAVLGNPGTGRTFAILSAVHKLVKDHRSLGVRLSPNAINPIPSPDVVGVFLAEISRACAEAHISGPDRVVFWAEFTPDSGVLSQFHRIAAAIDFPMVLLYEAVEPSGAASSMFGEDTVVVRVDDEMTREEKAQLGEYLLHLVKEHKFPEISKDEVSEVIAQERTFLPIVYRVLDPARRSIDKIVQEEFASIQDQVSRDCILLCSLSTSVDLPFPLAVLRKAVGQMHGSVLSYPEMFEIVERQATFLKESEDVRTNAYVAVYHPLIAQYLATTAGREAADVLLETVAEVVDLRSRVEADFVGRLLIEKGVNWEPWQYRPFSEAGLEAALLAIMKRQPARPVIHHLARLYYRRNPLDTEIVELLEAALAEPTESYGLSERKEHVMTTLANVMWEQNKDSLVNRGRNDPDVRSILELLSNAQQATPIRGAHAYHIHARILRELWSSREGVEKLTLMNEAIEVLEDGLSAGLDDPEQIEKLEDLRLEILSELDYDRAVDEAEALLKTQRDGTGYYTLARIEYHKNRNPVKASLFLDKALGAKQVPPSALALKLEILLQDSGPIYANLARLADQLAKDPRFRETWKSAYHKAVVYMIVGRYEDAFRFFRLANEKAPFTLQRRVQLFWMENGLRRTHTGKIGDLTANEGYVYAHRLPGWRGDIYFSPRFQQARSELQPGLLVEYELGFSPKGPVAFDVRPRTRR